MNQNKTIGLLLLAGVIGVFIPYTILTMTFDYPDILREDVGIILTKFNEGGRSLILTWWAFAILGLPLLVAYILIGQKLENRVSFARWATTIGVISIIVQLIGLLRWVFVVPVIAHDYSITVDEATRAANISSFKTIHQFAGVLLGEHIGQLFTIGWTILISIAFLRVKMFPKWISWFGIFVSLIYLLAQLELFATVMPGFPVLDMAGFIGSTLWLVWLMIVGILFIKLKPELKKL